MEVATEAIATKKNHRFIMFFEIVKHNTFMATIYVYLREPKRSVSVLPSKLKQSEIQVKIKLGLNNLIHVRQICTRQLLIVKDKRNDFPRMSYSVLFHETNSLHAQIP